MSDTTNPTTGASADLAADLFDLLNRNTDALCGGVIDRATFDRLQREIWTTIDLCGRTSAVLAIWRKAAQS